MKDSSSSRKRDVEDGRIYFDPRTGSMLKKNGEEVFLEHRLKGFFALLFEHKNTVVTREELMSFVWKEVVVSEESVTKAASDLRKFFKANKLSDFELITIPKLGYKLEVKEPALPNDLKPSLFFSIVKVAAYAILALFVLVILIRAIRY